MKYYCLKNKKENKLNFGLITNTNLKINLYYISFNANKNKIREIELIPLNKEVIILDKDKDFVKTRAERIKNSLSELLIGKSFRDYLYRTIYFEEEIP